MTQVNPPTDLRVRVLSAVQPQRTAPAVLRLWVAGFALAAVVAAMLGGISISLNQRLAAVNERLAAQEQVLALLASPTTKTATLFGLVQAKVRFVYDPDRKQGALVVSDLGDPGAEFVFELQTGIYAQFGWSRRHRLHRCAPSVCLARVSSHFKLSSRRICAASV